MRPLAALAMVLAGGLAACLVVGWGGLPACGAGAASASCVGASMPSTVAIMGAVATLGLVAVGLFATSVLWHLRRHRRMFALLDHLASPGRLAGHAVELVPGLTAPCVAGLARPRIYCPEDLADRLSQGELRAVVLHERYHQLTHAPARLVALAALGSAVDRLGAGRRWSERRRAAIEIAADDHALGTGVGRSDLARALLKLGSGALDAGLPSYATASEIRLRHLLGEPSPAGQRLVALGPLAMAIASVLACLLRAPVA